MSSIQERLQLKRVPLDTWNIREQLCLASAVVRSGDQNWMSVSRALKTVGEPNRPADWYSQKSCAAQYGALLEHVETPKRKKRSSEGAVETPQESILKRLTQERIVEIQKTIAEINQQYEQVKNEITEVRNQATSEDRLKEIWSAIEAAKRVRERENARRAAWLKEREERRARAERPWRPAQSPGASGGVGAPASPLLTSLLKSSPVVTTPQHLPHPATVVETVSPSAGAPTLSMLLDKSAVVAPTIAPTAGPTAAQESKNAAIEHIKSQLVQIEQQLKASSTPPPLVAPPPVDIDDIEIKAEDVYAFRDIDIHIPPVTTMHKGNTRAIEKPVFKKDEVETPMVAVEEVPSVIEPPHEDRKIDEVVSEPATEEVLTADIEPAQAPVQEAPIEEEPLVEVEAVDQEVKIVFPEVKFPTTEIKVIQHDDQKNKEDVKDTEVPLLESQREQEVEVNVEDIPVNVDVLEESVEPPQEVEVSQPIIEEKQEQHEPLTEPVETVEPPPDPESIPLPPDPVPEEIVTGHRIGESSDVAPEPEVAPMVPKEEPVEQPAEETPETAHEELHLADMSQDVKKDDDTEDSIPLKEMIKDEVQETEVKVQLPEPEETHTETDDDTPMELSREEEKDGKKKRDYSRKKKPDSRTCSGSESAPDSPSANDAERQHRLWKKSVMLVYSRLCAHKYASLFLRPISDEEAPGYSLVVKRPMDLTTVRRNIEAGVIRTTAEFQRDVLLMLSNALMYNNSEHSVYMMAKEMHEEAQCQLGMLVAAQAHAGLVPGPPPPQRRKRRRPDSPSLYNKRPH